MYWLSVLEEVRTHTSMKEMDTIVANIRKVRRVFEPEVVAKEEAEREKMQKLKERRARRLNKRRYPPDDWPSFGNGLPSN